MYELFVRIETLLQPLTSPVLLGIGLPAVLVGLVLWLGGSRYSTMIIGLLGAVVGSFVGLLISQWLNLQPWLSMLVGAMVLAILSILLRNVLILILAVLVFSAVTGAGYLSVVLDRIAPPQAEPQGQALTASGVPVQSFSNMEPAQRLNYMNDITQEDQTFADRLKALLTDTWNAVGSQGVMVIVAVVVGAVVGILLVWFIAKVIIALAYSLVGTAAILLGTQAALLGMGYNAVSALDARRWLLPITFITMTVIGWVWQLFFAGPKHKPPHAKESEESEK
jgi:hypothetical protein